jgi:hypothetical protein
MRNAVTWGVPSRLGEFVRSLTLRGPVSEIDAPVSEAATVRAIQAESPKRLSILRWAGAVLRQL